MRSAFVRREHREAILEQAVAICRHDESGDPDRPDLVRLRGLLAHHYARDLLTRPYLAYAVALDPALAAHVDRESSDAADLHVATGRACMEDGRVEAAIDAFRTALSVSPRHIEAARRLVCALERIGADDERAGAWFSLGAALQ